MPQYAKPLTLHKGVDNAIQFQFLNQEQRPVDITGKVITCRILKYDGSEILLEKILTDQLPATGIAVLELDPDELLDIDAQKAHYSIEIPVGNFDYPVFVDQNAGGRGEMHIVNSILPSFIPSMEVSIPSGQQFPNLSNISNINSAVLTYYSSVLDTDARSFATLSVELSGYHGNITVQGSTVSNADWYPISTSTYVSTTDTVGESFAGYHPYIRLKFDSPVGDIVKILLR